MTINKDLRVVQSSGGTLTVTGGITAGSSGIRHVMIDSAGNVVVSGTLAVAVVNSGTVTLSTANTYTGGTTISSGTL